MRTPFGYGSGVVVRDRVVLTAAHVLYNEATTNFADEIWWYFQRHKGMFEPLALRPGGIVVPADYVTARATNASPEALRPLDVAALYFPVPLPRPGRGGSSGYLASDAPNNEWLVFADRPRFIAGYPMAAPVAVGQQGRLFTTPNTLTAPFLPRGGGVFETAHFTGLPGMSGGGLFVRQEGDYYFPAAIYLGGSSESALVRAIDSTVIGLLDTASRGAQGITNHYSAGQLLVSVVGSSLRNTYVRVMLGPPSALRAGRSLALQRAGRDELHHFDQCHPGETDEHPHRIPPGAGL